MGLTWRKAEAAGMTEVVPTLTSRTEALVQEEGSTAPRSTGSRRLGAQLEMQAAVVGASSTVVGRTEERCQGCDELMPHHFVCNSRNAYVDF